MAAEHFCKGQTIFREGEKSHDAYFIVQGTVQVSIDTEHGPQELAVLGSGEIFGEMGMIMDRPRSATATALETTLVERITEQDFESYFISNPERLRTYLATLFERIRRTDLLLRAAETAPAAPAVPAAAPATPQESAQDFHVHLRMNSPVVNREITRLPFRIGRRYFDTAVSALARNDLSIDDAPPYQLSRNHCEIVFEGGHHLLRDCGSKFGSWVRGQHVGVDGVLSIELPVGDTEIIFGEPSSPHRAVVTIERCG